MVDLVGKLSRDTKDNRTALNKLSDDAEKMRVDITTLFRLNNEFRQEMDEISEKVADLYVLKKMMNVSFSRLQLKVKYSVAHCHNSYHLCYYWLSLEC